MNLNLIKKYFSPKSVLDIGAHFGEFNDLCRYFFPESKILSIEGNEKCSSVLRQKNINYLICLLGSTNRKAIFYKNKDETSTGHSIYKELTHHYNEMVLIKEVTYLKTLDDLLKENNIEPNFDLIKLDTQGSEIDILKGGTDLFKNAKGFLLEVSYKPYNENAPLEYEVIKFMSEYNFYPVEELDHHPSTAQKDLFFIRK